MSEWSERKRPLSEIVREGTREAHSNCERRVGSVDRWRWPQGANSILVGWLGTYRTILAAAEGITLSQPARDEVLPLAAEGMTWLLEDLGSMHRPPEQGLEFPALLREMLTDPARSWGIAYVLRGSRLGNRMILRALTDVGARDPIARPPIPESAGNSPAAAVPVRFLSAGGDGEGRQWVAFRRRLEAVLGVDDDPAPVLAAAAWTFGWVADRLSPAPASFAGHGAGLESVGGRS